MSHGLRKRRHAIVPLMIRSRCVLMHIANGRVLLDPDDFEKVRHRPWFAARIAGVTYAMSNGRKGEGVRMHAMHRVILGLARGGTVVDHRNMNGLDNRRNNLRPCDRARNGQNRGKADNGSRSRFKGVTVENLVAGKPYAATIGFGGKTKRLGRYPTEAEAARAYDRAAVELHGEFARTNQALGLLY